MGTVPCGIPEYEVPVRHIPDEVGIETPVGASVPVEAVQAQCVLVIINCVLVAIGVRAAAVGEHINGVVYIDCGYIIVSTVIEYDIAGGGCGRITAVVLIGITILYYLPCSGRS